ncbi:putative reverse transcriptase zinc-binding domain-containing protein [Helianthus annuus]|nr:putative reverse transcriptase zinc-binding domain-containing protein [Helianthus annuus]
MPLSDCNLSLLAKWHWRFKSQKLHLWNKVISALHGGPSRRESIPCNKYIGGVWKQVSKVGDLLKSNNVNLENFIRGVVGNGKHIRFWTDLWFGDSSLMLQCPLLFSLESDKDVCVADRVMLNNGALLPVWSWIRPPDTRAELDELLFCSNVLRDGSFSEAEDLWQWTGDKSGSFSVRSVRLLLHGPSRSSPYNFFKWNKWLPLKVNIFGWRMALNRLPSKDCLLKRNIQVVNDLCPFCSESPESLEHLFTAYRCAHEVWYMISSWINSPQVMAFSVLNILRFHENINGSSIYCKAVQSVILLTCWVLWKHRNNITFNGMKMNLQGIVDEVKVLGFLWLKSRAKGLNLSKHQWDSFYFM